MSLIKHAPKRILALLGTLVAVSALLFVSSETAQASNSDRLTAGHILKAGQILTSQNGAYEVVMQYDGNFVEYDNHTGKPVWATNTSRTDAVEAVMQADGNFVLYNAKIQPVWATNSYGTSANMIGIQNDGNFVAYDGAGKPIWWRTLTIGFTTNRNNFVMTAGHEIVSFNRQYAFIMQPDGNLVEYNAQGIALWTSETGGNNGAFAVFQTDGNLVVYTPAIKPLWASNTYGKGGVLINMQNDGNFVMYTSANQPVFATR